MNSKPFSTSAAGNSDTSASQDPNLIESMPWKAYPCKLGTWVRKLKLKNLYPRLPRDLELLNLMWFILELIRQEMLWLYQIRVSHFYAKCCPSLFYQNWEPENQYRSKETKELILNFTRPKGLILLKHI